MAPSKLVLTLPTFDLFAQTNHQTYGRYRAWYICSPTFNAPVWLMLCGSDAQHMQCHGWSIAIRSFRLPTFRSTFIPKPIQNTSRFAFLTRPVAQSRPFGSAVTANAPEQATRHETESPPELSPSALARAASQTIRMCAKEKQFGDALYILNSMRFSIYPPSPNPPPSRSERAASTWIAKPERSQLLSSTPSSIKGYTFIDFGQPVPTRLASHSFLHTLVKAGLPTKAAAQAELMMADGIRIRTKTMESILASTVDQSSYPPVKSLRVPLGKIPLNAPSMYPIADTHTRIAVRLLEEARRRRQERTHSMYDIVINACLIQGEIIVASLLLIMGIKDWQLRQALKNQLAIDPPPEPSIPLTAAPIHPTRRTRFSLLERINHALTTRKDPQDPLFQNAIQALANLAFAVDTGQLPPRVMGSLIKVLYSVPKSHAVVHIGSPPEVQSVNAYRYIHQVLRRLVNEAGGNQVEQRDLVAGRKLNVHAFTALLCYCIRHRLPKPRTSDLLEVMKERWQDMTGPSVNLLLRSSTLLRDDTIRTNERRSVNDADATPIALPATHHAKRPLTRWAQIVNVLKLELTIRYPSEPVICTPTTPDSYTVTALISHFTATDRGHIIAEKLAKIIPELDLADEGSSRIPVEERSQRAVSYGPHFFTTILNALVKGGRTGHAERVWRLAVEAEKASWVGGNEPWFLPIHAYTCMVQLSSQEGRVRKAASLRRNSNCGVVGWSRRRPDTFTMSKQVFRAVQARCQFLEAAKEKDHTLSQVPRALREFAPDERYFNALLDLYGRRILGYAKPVKSDKSYWRRVERIASDRFARTGVTTIYWHPMLAEIVAEMHKYGYQVPEGLRFLLVGRISGMDIGNSEPLRPSPPGPLPLPRQNFHRIPTFKTRGLPVPRGKRRRRVRHGA